MFIAGVGVSRNWFKGTFAGNTYIIIINVHTYIYIVDKTIHEYIRI